VTSLKRKEELQLISIRKSIRAKQWTPCIQSYSITQFGLKTATEGQPLGITANIERTTPCNSKSYIIDYRLD
jgi:hypothetical protein